MPSKQSRPPGETPGRLAVRAIVVTLNEEALKDIRSVAEQLAAQGMEVERVLPLTGVITGSCSAAGKPALAAVPGVAAVEYDAGTPLVLPSSSLQ